MIYLFILAYYYNTMENTTEEINHNLCTIEKCEAYCNSDVKNLICSANFCAVCGINMGDNNPRQLCRKTYCPREDEDYDYKKKKI